MILSVVMVNNFLFSANTLEHHIKTLQDPCSEKDCRSTGLWIMGSRINHSCLSNVHRSFIADMMILRASQDLDAGTELVHTYVNPGSTYDERVGILNQYGFQCDCLSCESEKLIPDETINVRHTILLDQALTKINSFPDFYRKLDAYEATYKVTAEIEPRLSGMITVYSTIKVCHEKGYDYDVFLLALRLLDLVGFRVSHSSSHFTVARWGSVHDMVVSTLVFLWNVLGSSGPFICDDVETIAKTAYTIQLGECDTFEETYGKWRPDTGDVGSMNSVLNQQLHFQNWSWEDFDALFERMWEFGMVMSVSTNEETGTTWKIRPTRKYQLERQNRK